MKITAIYGSPRKDGNTDLLMKSFLRGIKKSGAQTHEIFIRDLKFSPCIECGGCDKTGKCVIKDDMGKVYPHLIDSDVIVVSAPVFFYALNAQTKALIDRCQCFWVNKYLLSHKISDEKGTQGKGIFLSASGSKGKKNFDGIFFTVRYFFDVLDIDFSHHLVYRNIDVKGAIAKDPTALDDAYKLGLSIVDVSL
jgi:multimeric flavodoxin WrbA